MNNKYYHVSNQKMYSTTTALHRTVTVDGLSIFYREAGDQSNPKLVLLHGFPASSHQYRNLILALALHTPEVISPDNWNIDYRFMERPDARRVQMDLFYDYRTNVEMYPKWQEFLRQHQPKSLIFWGQNDIIFTHEGGEAYLKDLPNAEMHRLDTGHFAAEDYLDEIAAGIHRFYPEKVKKTSSGTQFLMP